MPGRRQRPKGAGVPLPSRAQTEERGKGLFLLCPYVAASPRRHAPRPGWLPLHGPGRAGPGPAPASLRACRAGPRSCGPAARPWPDPRRRPDTGGPAGAWPRHRKDCAAGYRAAVRGPRRHAAAGPRAGPDSAGQGWAAAPRPAPPACPRWRRPAHRSAGPRCGVRPPRTAAPDAGGHRRVPGRP